MENNEMELYDIDRKDNIIFNLKDTIRLLESGFKNPILLIKFLFNFLVVIYILVILFISSYYKINRLILLSVLVLMLLFFRNGKVINLFFFRRKYKERIDLSYSEIVKFTDTLVCYDNEKVEFKRVTLLANKFICNKLKKTISDKKILEEKCELVVICAINNDEEYIIDVKEENEYLRVYRKMSKRRWNKFKDKIMD